MGFLINPYSVAAASGGYLLDEYPGAGMAFSLRLLDSGYSGAAIRVREDSGDTEADIGFDGNGDLDETALLAHCGSADGLIVQWYDQSGNGRDWSMTSPLSAQPQIVTGSAVNKVNGKPAIKLGSGKKLLTADFDMSGFSASTHFSVQDLELAPEYKIPWLSGGAWYYGIMQISGTSAPDANSGSPDYYKNGSGSAVTPDTRGALWTAFVAPEAQTLLTILDLDLDAWLRYKINGYAPTLDFTGHIQENIIYDSDQTANKGDIEDNINAYYSIY